jgi:hypothetical protein
LSKIQVDTIDTRSGTATMTIGSSNTSTIALKSGATLTNFPANTPAFEAQLASDMNVTDNAQTKVTCGTEIYDTDSAYDNSSNYRFTPQTAGKYYVYGGVGSITDTSKLKESRAMIYKNGSRYRTSTSDPRDNYGYHYNNYVAAVVDMNGSSDYVELYGLTNKEGGTDCKITVSHENSTYFGAYRIIT